MVSLREKPAPDSALKDHTMAAALVPHLCNDAGVAKIDGLNRPFARD